MFERAVTYEAAHVGLDPHVPDSVKTALAWAYVRAGKDWSRVTIVVPTLSNLRDSESLSGIPASVVTLSWKTMKSFPRKHTRTIVACWPNQDTLDYLDDLDIDHLCVVPWADGEIDSWRFARNAVDLLDGSTSQHEPALDPVVKAALETLTLRVNLSTGLAHPSDRSAAISMFRLLKGAGYQWDSHEIRIWAMQNGWRSGDIPDLIEKADGVAQGKRYRTGGPGWADNILNQWKERASSS